MNRRSIACVPVLAGGALDGQPVAGLGDQAAFVQGRSGAGDQVQFLLVRKGTSVANLRASHSKPGSPMTHEGLDTLRKMAAVMLRRMA